MTRFTNILCVCVVALVGAFYAPTASASFLFYTFAESGPGGPTFSFYQSTNPTPISFADGEFTEVPITKATGALAGENAFFWYSSSGGDAQFAYSPQGYNGPESAPTFFPGSFVSPQDPNTGNFGLLTAVGVAGTPEPAVWTIMLVGLGALGSMLRLVSRKNKAAVA